MTLLSVLAPVLKLIAPPVTKTPFCLVQSLFTLVVVLGFSAGLVSVGCAGCVLLLLFGLAVALLLLIIGFAGA